MLHHEAEATNVIFPHNPFGLPHTGNQKFRALCFARKALFDHANHAAKKRICAEIWQECVQQHGSRYLKRKPNEEKGPWYEQPASVAELKAAQVMRDYKRPDRVLQREITAAKGKKRIRTTATPMDHVPVEPTPVQPIVECPEGVHPHDVLSGRGAFVAGHAGNKRLRDLAAQRKQAFEQATYAEKRTLADDIVTEIFNLDPPGRFLTKNPETGTWTDVLERDRCLHKACQVMRDMDRADRKERERLRKLRKVEKEARMAEMAAAVGEPTPIAALRGAPMQPTMEETNKEEVTMQSVL